MSTPHTLLTVYGTLYLLKRIADSANIYYSVAVNRGSTSYRPWQLPVVMPTHINRTLLPMVDAGLLATPHALPRYIAAENITKETYNHGHR